LLVEELVVILISVRSHGGMVRKMIELLLLSNSSRGFGLII